MDRIDVHGRLARARRHDRHGRCAARQRGKQLASNLLQHRAHVADGAVAEERHRAVRDAAMGLDLGPPDAAMAQADAVLVQRFGDDDVLDASARNSRALRQIGDAAIAAGFLVGGAEISIAAGKSGKVSMKASAAMIEAASPPFMSQAPRP
jgi:hypothetical protein